MLHEITDSCERLIVMSQQLFSAVIGTHAHACHVLFECSEISLRLLIKLFDCCDKERGYSLSETQHLFQRFCIGSNGSGYPFEPNCHSFEQLGLSVEKIVIHSKGSHYPLEKKIVIRSSGSSYPFKTIRQFRKKTGSCVEARPKIPWRVLPARTNAFSKRSLLIS